MTENEWETTTELRPMLAFLRGKASDRKLRLFACAGCRRVWHLLNDERSRRGVGDQSGVTELIGKRVAESPRSKRFWGQFSLVGLIGKRMSHALTTANAEPPRTSPKESSKETPHAR
jgi:hypothetical protein